MRLFNIRGIIFIIILILSAALYLFTEARYAALLLIMLFLILIGALVTANVTGRQLKASVIAPLQGTRGEPAHVIIQLENKDTLPVLRCAIQVAAENLLTDERDVFVQFLSVGRKKKANADFMIREERCGCIRIRIEDLLVTDPLGIISVRPKSLDIEEKGTGWISFLPRAAETRIPEEELASYDMESYKYSSLNSGSDPSETFDIREYERNDSIKAIHWKLTGKMDEIMIRDFGLPIENKVMMIVDKSLAEKSGAEDLIEHAADFVSSLSYTLLSKEINHTVGWYDYLENKFQTFRVDDENSFWLAVRGLISSPFRTDESSAAARFVESDSSRDYSSYIYVSDDGSEIERLMNYGAVALYRPEDFR